MILSYLKKGYSLLLFVFLINQVFPQTYHIHNYTEEEGLPASQVFSVVKDKTGKMWFSTEKGLSSYDGSNWKLYNSDEYFSDTDKLKFLKDEGENLWAVSHYNNVLKVFLFKNNNWELYTEYLFEQFNVRITSIDLKTKERNIEILVGTADKGLFYYVDGYWSQILDSRLGKNINFIKKYDGRFFICSNNGVFGLDYGKIDYTINKKINDSRKNVKAILKDESAFFLLRNNKLIRVTDSGFKDVYQFEEKNILSKHIGKFDKVAENIFLFINPDGVFLLDVNRKKLVNLSQVEGVLTGKPYCYYLDDEKNLWMASYFGISKIISFRFENYQAIKNKFKQEVPAIVELDKGEIVFASNEKLFFLNDKTSEINEIVKDISREGIKVFSLARTSDKKLVIAGQKLGVGLWEPGKRVKWYKQNFSVYKIAIDKSDNLWITDDESVYKFDFNKTFKIDIPEVGRLRNIFVSPENDVFIPTAENGVLKINKDGSHNLFFSKDNKDYNNTFHTYFDNSVLMVGSKAGVLKTRGDSLVPYFSDDKMKNRSVYFIKRDLENKLWFGTSSGVYSWNDSELKNYTTKQGLLGLETYRSGSLLSEDGSLWIGTDRGLSKYRTDYDFLIEKPKVIIDSMKINDLVFLDNSNIELNHSYNDLEIYFRSSSFINEKENTFKVFLEGYDEDWSDEIPIRQHIIRYLNIPPGEYRLHLRVKNVNGDFSEDYVSSEIKILSPFYNSWKFLFIIVIITGMIIVLITRYVVNFRYTANLEDEIIKRTKELDESQKRYFQMFNDNKAIMIIIDPLDGKILDANKSALSYYKYTIEEFKELNFKNIDHLYQNEYYQNFKSTGNQNHYETQHKIATGELKEVDLYFSIINVKGKNLIYTIVHDIVDKKVAERSLIESEEKYRALINNMQDGVFVLKDHKFSFVNAAFAIMVGYRSEELAGMAPKKLIAREDFKQVFKKYALILSGEKIAEEHEFRLIHRASGNFVYVNATFSVVHYQGSYALLGTIKNITIRKRQEVQLRKLSTAVEQSPTGIIITNLDGNIEYVNPRFSEITGYGIYEVIKKKPSILKSGTMEDKVYDKLWKTIKKGQIWRGELCNRKKNGELYWISCAISPIKDEKGEVTHFIAVQTDITFQKFAQEKIETQQQQLSSILNNMPLILFAVDKEDKFTFVRGKGLDLFNIESSQLVGRSFNLIFRNSPEFINDFQNTIKEKKQTRIIRELEGYYFEIHLIPVFNSKNKYLGINGIAYDITQRFKTQKALKESEERYRSLYENSSVGIYRSTKGGYILMANPTLVKMLGYNSIEELSKHNLEDNDFNVKYDRTEFVNRLETDGVVKGLETIWIRSDNQILYVRESARRIVNITGDTLFYDGVIEDITEMKLAEQELVKSEARNRAMLYAIPDIVLEITLDGEILASHMKDSDAEILQLPTLLTGKNIFDLVNNYLKENTRSIISKVIKTKTVEVFEFTLKYKGKIHFFESRFVISGASSVIVMLRDITDRKEGEKMLIRAKDEAEKSDKLKSEFLAQMSHEIRTPINSILSFTSLIKEEVIDKVEEDLRVCFDVIDNGGHRLIRTIDSILNMSQLQSGTYQPIYTEVDMDKDVLRNAVAELKQRAKEKNLELEYNINTENVVIKADNYTVGQIFINLIDNAIKYTDEGIVTVNVSRDKNEKLVINVLDTGIGISEEYIPNLFKPFTQEESGYTRRYEGNGLGLALVKNYAEINNALIEVESKKGIGTRFGVKFN